jgi:hypothetical protein
MPLAARDRAATGESREGAGGRLGSQETSLRSLHHQPSWKGVLDVDPPPFPAVRARALPPSRPRRRAHRDGACRMPAARLGEHRERRHAGRSRRRHREGRHLPPCHGDRDRRTERPRRRYRVRTTVGSAPTGGRSGSPRPASTRPTRRTAGRACRTSSPPNTATRLAGRRVRRPNCRRKNGGDWRSSRTPPGSTPHGSRRR